MTRSNIARRHGDDFQARLFWLKAASLLDPLSPVIKVAYETGPKSFDDIQIEYDPKGAPPDHDGKPIYRRHIQCKWHATAGTFGFENLINPAFINAERYSLLQRALQAQTRHAPDGFGCRLELVTNWRLKADDPLLELVRKESDALHLDLLFDGTTDKSRMGKVRKLWREHLQVDDARLGLVTRLLAIAETPESLASLRERLDEKFSVVGMKRVPSAESAFSYDDLITKLLSQGRIEFDEQSFREMASKEGILDTSSKPRAGPAVGIRSFMHPINSLEDRCERMLNLVPYFDGRYIRNEMDWQERILPELQAFVTEAARLTDNLRLILDAHVSLAFATGALLNVKSGKHIEIEQRTGGRRFWSIVDQPVDSHWPKLIFEEEVVDEHLSEVAVAIGLTHDISDAVSGAVKSAKRAGRILHCRPAAGVSQQSVHCGRHAWMLAESVVQKLRAIRASKSGTPRTHIFIAGPNGFAFFLGQHQQAIGPASLYEWDFDGQRGGGYGLGLTVGAQPL